MQDRVMRLLADLDDFDDPLMVEDRPGVFFDSERGRYDVKKKDIFADVDRCHTEFRYICLRFSRKELLDHLGLERAGKCIKKIWNWELAHYLTGDAPGLIGAWFVPAGHWDRVEKEIDGDCIWTSYVYIDPFAMDYIGSIITKSES